MVEFGTFTESAKESILLSEQRTRKDPTGKGDKISTDISLKSSFGN